MASAQHLQREAEITQAMALGAWLEQRRTQRGVVAAFDSRSPNASVCTPWPPPAPMLPKSGAPAGNGGGEPTEPTRARVADPCKRCDVLTEAAEHDREELIRALKEPLVQAATTLGQAAAELEGRVVADVLQLATRLAERVIARAVELDPEIVLSSLDRALSAVGELERVTVLCHPDDFAVLSENAQSMGVRRAGQLIVIEVKATADIRRGGCLVKFDEGLLDARMETQLAELSEAVAKSMAPPGGRARGQAGAAP